jgi:hypothetical protein
VASFLSIKVNPLTGTSDGIFKLAFRFQLFFRHVLGTEEKRT